MAETEVKEEVDMTYTKELRNATKDVHKLSDVLVNAKFALALSDDAVWYDGLLAFYEIYKFFESKLPETLVPKELHRTESFEKDLAFFYGADWKENYEPRESVQKYLNHLAEVHKKSDLLLFAYAFQMYMALMSGGQLLQKKRMMARKLWFSSKEDEVEEAARAAEAEEKLKADPNIDPKDLQARPMPLQVKICPDGCATTYFTTPIADLKAKLRTILNEHYKNFDEAFKAEFIEESRNVFLYNGEVVRSIKGVNKAHFRRLAIVAVFVAGIYFALKLAK